MFHNKRIKITNSSKAATQTAYKLLQLSKSSHSCPEARAGIRELLIETGQPRPLAWVNCVKLCRTRVSHASCALSMISFTYQDKSSSKWNAVIVRERKSWRQCCPGTDPTVHQSDRPCFLHSLKPKSKPQALKPPPHPLKHSLPMCLHVLPCCPLIIDLSFLCYKRF